MRVTNPRTVRRIVCATVGIVFAFIVPWVSIAIYALVAVIWLIPDRRIERALRES